MMMIKSVPTRTNDLDSENSFMFGQDSLLCNLSWNRLLNFSKTCV